MLKSSRQASAAGSPVWLYHFAHKGKYQFVTHACELGYVFANCGRLPAAAVPRVSCQGAGVHPSATERRVEAAVSGYWAAFAQRHNPNPLSPDSGLPQWPQYRAADDTGMRLDEVPSPEAGYRAEADALWRARLA